MLIPWIAALLVYAVFCNLTLARHSPIRFLAGVGQYILICYYHLWFVAGLISWILLSWVFLKAGLKLNQILISGLILSAVTLFFRDYSNPNPAVQHTAVGYIINATRPYFYFFFVLGGWLRQQHRSIPKALGASLAIVFLAIDIFLFYQPIIWVSNILFFGLNIVLIVIMISWIEKKPDMSNRPLEWIGINSLPIYLWHVLPIMVAYKIGADSALKYYGSAVVLLIFGFALIFILRKSAFASKYLLGLPPSISPSARV